MSEVASGRVSGFMAMSAATAVRWMRGTPVTDWATRPHSMHQPTSHHDQQQSGDLSLRGSWEEKTSSAQSTKPCARAQRDLLPKQMAHAVYAFRVQADSQPSGVRKRRTAPATTNRHRARRLRIFTRTIGGLAPESHDNGRGRRLLMRQLQLLSLPPVLLRPRPTLDRFYPPTKPASQSTHWCHHNWNEQIIMTNIIHSY